MSCFLNSLSFRNVCVIYVYFVLCVCDAVARNIFIVPVAHHTCEYDNKLDLTPVQASGNENWKDVKFNLSQTSDPRHPHSVKVRI